MSNLFFGQKRFLFEIRFLRMHPLTYKICLILEWPLFPLYFLYLKCSIEEWYNWHMQYPTVVQYLGKLAGHLPFLDGVEIEKAINLLRLVKQDKGIVWIVGNGGSAATASHFANDLLKMGGIRAIALPDLTATMLAYGNDYAWEDMFDYMLKNLMKGEDCLVAISCSGNSANILRPAATVEFDRLIVLSGNKQDNNLVARGAYALICAEAEDIRLQEDMHLAICHAIVGALREA